MVTSAGRPSPTNVTSDRRRAISLAVAGLISAVVLGLGVNGTLASWTTAIITNSNNSASVVNAVALQESNADGTVVCADTATTQDNTAACESINKYGGTATPMTPGQSVTTTVTLRNTGTGAGLLTVDGRTCTPTPVSATSLCSVMTVAVACPAGTAVFAVDTLNAFDTAAPSTVSASLAPDSTIQCDITVTLPATAPASVAGQTVSQPIVWTLTSV